jgi:formylmethanofuran dehydrogenase subunit E
VSCLSDYALSLFDKYTGEGVRVYLDARKQSRWEDVADWYLKRKPKPEQNSERILKQIRAAGDRMVAVEPVLVQDDFLIKRSKGSIRFCPLCREAYPERHGELCRRCRGDSPYREWEGRRPEARITPR